MRARMAGTTVGLLLAAVLPGCGRSDGGGAARSTTSRASSSSGSSGGLAAATTVQVEAKPLLLDPLLPVDSHRAMGMETTFTVGS